MEKKNLDLICLIWILVFGLVAEVRSVGDGEPCEFPAIFNFGDSNSATGENITTSGVVSAALGHLAGRLSDGRLIIDFIAESLKLPHLTAYPISTATDFKYGANFAHGGASITPPGLKGGVLGLQISDFIQFKAKATDLYKQFNQTTPPNKIIVPTPEGFSKALYTIDIGHNDLAQGFEHSTPGEVIESIPAILSQFAQAVEQLYKEGARFFWVHNTGPIGCLPVNYILDPTQSGNMDQNGCVKPRNEVAEEFNRQLKSRISNLRAQLSDAVITYVDVYSIKYDLVSHAKSLGFMDPLNFCCQIFPVPINGCETKAIVNGTAYGNACKDPSRRIVWDGVHYTEAANRWIAQQIINGSFSDPPVSVQNGCHHP